MAFASDKKNEMKKLLLAIFFFGAMACTASAQTETKANTKKAKVERPHSETKVKRTTTPSQKVHNVLHRKKKHYSGVKVKHEAKKTK